MVCEGAGARLWKRQRGIREGGAVRLKLCCLPSHLPGLEQLLERLGGGFAWYASLGIGFVSASDLAPEDLSAARQELTSRGGSLVILAGPQALRAAGDPC